MAASRLSEGEPERSRRAGNALRNINSQLDNESVMSFTVIHGDLLDQQVEVIVNPWNRNIFPWWLLIPQGVSGAIKRRAGLRPFQELAHMGPIPLGEARVTGAGRLPFRAIIHVAGINLLWFATERSVRHSVRSAMRLVAMHRYRSVAFPLIGSGSGQRGRRWSRQLISDELKQINYDGRIVLVEFGAHDRD